VSGNSKKASILKMNLFTFNDRKPETQLVFEKNFRLLLIEYFPFIIKLYRPICGQMGELMMSKDKLYLIQPMPY
jgi:hypothetical protein